MIRMHFYTIFFVNLAYLEDKNLEKSRIRDKLYEYIKYQQYELFIELAV